MRGIDVDNSIVRRKIFTYFEDTNRSLFREEKNCPHHPGKHGNHSYYVVDGEGALLVGNSQDMGYEMSINQSEETFPHLVASSVRKDRRVLFGSYVYRGNSSSYQRSHSCGTLNHRFVSGNARHVVSDSELAYLPSKQLVSCLRPSTYSANEASAKTLRMSSSHVSFDVNIKVLKYDVPSEQWAPTGWSDYFNQ
jgi:hypothetical protein